MISQRDIARWPIAVSLILAAGCGDQPAPRPIVPKTVASTEQANPGQTIGSDADAEVGRGAIINSVMQMLRRAAENPGSQGFTMATERLNYYFEDAPAADFALSPGAKDFLEKRLDASLSGPLTTRAYTLTDARHIEDCILYNAVATRVAGEGDDLARATRLFAWLVRNVQLVPPGALAPPGGQQAKARPYDVLLRGMATEGPGDWSERSWVFIALCRQLNIDAAVLTIVPDGPVAEAQVAAWAVAVVVDGKPYLFDARIGLPIPGPGGKGVATLEQAIADPSILRALDLPGEDAYQTSAAALRRSKIGVLLDSTRGYLSPRMRTLERELSGRNRLVLHRDPAELEGVFSKALGGRFDKAQLWGMPLEVEVRLFTDPQFVAAAQFAMYPFDSKLPLLSARMAQLRGELTDAIQRYVAFRFAEGSMIDKATPMPRQLQAEMDMYATYFLGLAQLEKGLDDQAEFYFDQALKTIPEPEPGPPFCRMYRWGAHTNLGLLATSKGQFRRAAAEYAADVQTTDNQGHKLRARSLIWQDVFKH